MENEKKLVALSQKKLLAKVNSSIGITNKLIAENNKKLVVEIFERNPRFFIGLISQFYPLTLEILTFEKSLNWTYVSRENNITHLLNEQNAIELNKFKELDWKLVSQNENIIWSEEILNVFENKLDWEYLSENNNMLINDEILGSYSHKWDWNNFKFNETFPWSLEIIKKYENKWNWETLLRNKKNPLIIDLLEKHFENNDSDKFKKEISVNKQLRYLFEMSLKERDLAVLCTNASLEWNIELIENKIGTYKWNWQDISRNENLSWSLELIERFEDKWNWYSLSNNLSIKWTKKIIDRFEDKLIFDYYIDDDWGLSTNEEYGYSSSGMSSNKNVIWTEELIENYDERLNWRKLSRNENLPWSIEFFQKHINKWDWDLISANTNLPWSSELIEEYEDKWDYFSLSRNPRIPWTIKLIHKHTLKIKYAYYNLWKTLKPYVDDEMVINLLKKLENGELKS